MLLIVDANVLIDYTNSDISVLALVSRHVGHIYVPSVILDEVDGLTEEDCLSLGFTVVDEPIEILLTAGETRGALSFEDHVCLLLAAENEWTCVSNDKPLHRACVDESVAVMWGLRLMLELVDANHLEKDSAIEVAEAIQVSNPRHITPKIIEEFKRKVNLL